MFSARGFENFRGRVGIDNVIFNFVIRAGKAKFGDIFYDINLEVDSILPHTDGASEIQKSTSKDRISQESNPVNTNSMQGSDKTPKRSWKEIIRVTSLRLNKQSISKTPRYVIKTEILWLCIMVLLTQTLQNSRAGPISLNINGMQTDIKVKTQVA